MGERDDARHEIEDARERLSLIAEELSRRASPNYIRERAKEATVSKVNEIKTRTTTSPLALAILGGAVGAGLGAILARSQRQKHLDRRVYGEWDDTGRSSQRWQGSADVGYGRSDRWSEPAWQGSPQGSISDRGYGSELDRRSGIQGSDTSGLGSGTGVSGGYGAEAGYGGIERSGYGSQGSLGTSSGHGTGTTQGSLGAIGTEGLTPGREHGEHHGRKEQIKERGREMKERGREAKERLSHKADELKSRASSKFDDIKGRASNVRDRMPSSDEVRMRARKGWDQHPMMLSIVALIVGSVLGMLIPISRKEREALEPAKRRLREGVRDVGDTLDQRLQGEGEPSSRQPSERQGGSFGGQGGSFGGGQSGGFGTSGTSGGSLGGGTGSSPGGGTTPGATGSRGTSSTSTTPGSKLGPSVPIPGSRTSGTDRDIGGGTNVGTSRGTRSEDPSRGRAPESKPGLGGGKSLSGDRDENVTDKGTDVGKGTDIGKPTWPDNKYKS